MTDNRGVSQADRDAAVRLLESGDQDGLAKEVRLGNADHWPIVQAFARHRIAAEEAGARKALEAAAEKVNWVGIEESKATNQAGYQNGIRWCADRAADAIRALDPALIVRGE